MQQAAIAVAMQPDELAMLERYVRPGVRYLEFGAGGSTLFALDRGVARCDSVESDPAWVASLRQQPAVSEAEANGRLSLHPIDIGPVLDWGMPADRTGMARWPNYFLAVWARLEADPDVVLIDGRFRTACALAALAACPPSTAVLMHDFFDPLAIRNNYRTLLDVAEVADRASNLVSLKRKVSIPQRELLGRIGAVWADFG